MKLRTVDLLEGLDRFFDEYDASLLGTRTVSRDNFERLPAPGDGKLRAISAHVLCHNLDLFGTSGDYLDEIHPRIGTLGERLAAHLAAQGLQLSGPGAETSITIHPHPDPTGQHGSPLPRSGRQSWGQRLIPADELAANSHYYAELIRTYGPLCGVVTNNGTVIGPDGGLIAATCAVATTWPEPVRLLELGAGAASTAFALARRGLLASYRANDFSPDMVAHFEREVAVELAAAGVPASMSAGSCFDTPLDQTDLLDVGVYYQAQPALIARRGKEMADCLGSDGVLLIQSGMLEDSFVTDLLTGCVYPENGGWPWFDEQWHLNRYFRYVGRAEFAQETILYATNSRERYLSVTRAFPRDTSFRDFYPQVRGAVRECI